MGNADNFYDPENSNNRKGLYNFPIPGSKDKTYPQESGLSALSEQEVTQLKEKIELIREDWKSQRRVSSKIWELGFNLTS